MWLSTKNISTNQLSKKLDYKIIGIFDIIRKKNISLKLQLSQVMKIDNVLHPNLLWKTFINLLIGQVKELTPSVIIDNEKE